MGLDMAEKQAGMFPGHVRIIPCTIKAMHLCDCGFEVAFCMYLASVCCASLVNLYDPSLECVTYHTVRTCQDLLKSAHSAS